MTFICLNESCPSFEDRWQVQTETSMGGTYLVDQSAADCPTCHKEGKEWE